MLPNPNLHVRGQVSPVFWSDFGSWSCHRLDFSAAAANNASMARVVIEGLSKVFGGAGGQSVRAVDRASLTVEDKELLVLVGPSACGKTTTLRLIAGLEEPDQGTISIDGQIVNGRAPKERD